MNHGEHRDHSAACGRNPRVAVGGYAADQKRPQALMPLVLLPRPHIRRPLRLLAARAQTVE